MSKLIIIIWLFFLLGIIFFFGIPGALLQMGLGLLLCCDADQTDQRREVLWSAGALMVLLGFVAFVMGCVVLGDWDFGLFVGTLTVYSCATVLSWTIGFIEGKNTCSPEEPLCTVCGLKWSTEGTLSLLIMLLSLSNYTWFLGGLIQMGMGVVVMGKAKQ